MGTQQQLLTSLTEQLHNKDFVLPILPEICQRIRKALDDPNTDAQRLAKIISVDPALAVRVVQAANSSLFAGLNTVPSIQAAVGRLGFVCVQNIVMGLTLAQLYNFKNNPLMKKTLVELWHQSSQVAAYSAFIAKKFTPLDPYEALLAGLLHNIGALPVAVICSEHAGIKQYPELLPELIELVKYELGGWILQQWNFSPRIQEVPIYFASLDRQHSGLADYVDVVMAAHLITQHKGDIESVIPAWTKIQAFEKLGIPLEQLDTLINQGQKELDELSAILRG